MSWLLDHLTSLLLFLFLVLVAMALLSPFEALGWWAGWNKKELDAAPADHSHDDQQPPHRRAAQYAVYLTGVGGFSGAYLRPPEAAFVEDLRQHLTDAVIIHDVFPYSVDNNPLNGHRLLAWMWDWLQGMRERVPNNVFDILIVVRNALQVGVSADSRYGPIYNRGVAYELVKSLRRHGYPAEDGPTIYLVGYSGGVQVALGAAPYLKQALRARLHVISIGGVMANDPGIRFVEKVDHLAGSKDPLPPLGVASYPGRWKVRRRSAWNRAR
ncbi:MAG: hypothetical protein AB7N70_29300, partial [Dehalococcoidia bacterium]